MSTPLREPLAEFVSALRRNRPAQLLALLAVLLVAGVWIVTALRARATPPQEAAQAAIAAPAVSLPASVRQPTEPGLLKLDDFQIVLPKGWERRADWEDRGPGTKLFLLGPKLGPAQLVIGIDVYPLRKGTTLEQFTTQYSARWNPALLTNKPARVCELPARLLALTENELDKLYLVMVSGDRGYAVGMIAPAGQTAKSQPLFRQVVDTFQLYE